MLIVILILLGLCIGSFINAFVWRLHEQESKTTKTKKQHRELSITKGRSMCPNCKHTLGFSDLIPVLSWVFLRGKCRYCKKPIHWQYPLVEVLTTSLFVGSLLLWPYGFEPLGIFQFVAWLIVLAGFIALSIYDLRWMLLPNKVVFALTGLVAVQVTVLTIFERDIFILIGAFLGVLVLSGLFWLLFQLSSGRWIGGGDVKLAVALGLLVGGPVNAIFVLFLASLLGSLISVPILLISGNKNKHIPFGPFLMAGTTVVYLFGSTILDWYMSILIIG